MGKKNSDKTKNIDLNFTMQQKFDFESNSFDEEDTKILYKKNRRKKYEKTKREKELILLKNRYKRKYHMYIWISVILLTLVLLLAILYIFVKPKEITKEVIQKVNIVPENIVFLGDSITDQYDLEQYYSKNHYLVNSGISGNLTDDILDDMNKRVYQYNPSKVFLLIGTNDINEGKTNEEIVDNIKKIIDQIKEKRPYCKVYLESIYPINNSNDSKISHGMVSRRTNEQIKDINKKLQKYCKDNNITYIDMFDVLKNDDGDLNISYTKEGLHISDEGYKVITKTLLKYF